MKLHHLIAAAVLLAGSTMVHAKGGRSGGGHGSSGRPSTTIKSTTTIHKSGTVHKPAKVVTTHKITSGGKASFAKHPGTVKGFGSKTTVSVSKYASTYGKKLKSGFYTYKGKGHRHWTRRFYSSKWRTWTFYDPSTRGWFYWNRARASYLPVRYLTVAAPTPVAVDGPIADGPPNATDLPVATETADVPELPEPQ